MGLPTVRNPITERIILEALGNGQTATMAVAHAGIARSSYELWKSTDEVFSAKVRQAQAIAAGQYHDVVHKSALKTVADAKYMLERNPLTRDTYAAQPVTASNTLNVQLNIGRDIDRE